LGPNPSLALLYKTQPIVTSPMSWPLTKDGFGWSFFSEVSGEPFFIAGNGDTTIMSSRMPITYDLDKTFYSIDPNYTNLGLVYQNAGWRPFAYPFIADIRSITSDRAGNVYAADDNIVGKYQNNTWVTIPMQMNITDLAVSPYGKIAVAGFQNGGGQVVSWYDHKTMRWSTRTLSTIATNGGAPAIEWDSNGNLGVAYAPTRNILRYDSLNLRDGIWSSEQVLSQSNANFQGVALAFDRFNLPVIASGSILAYDPVVPEPMTLALLTMGGLLLRRKK